MFNEKQKLEYFQVLEIKYSENNRKDILSIFKNISDKYERPFNKDISLFSIDELKSVFKNMVSLSYKIRVKSILNQYVIWCQMMGYCDVNNIKKINFEELEEDNVKNVRYLSPEDIYGLVDLYLSSGGDVKGAAAFLGLYECIDNNMSFENLLNITMSDIDKDDKKINLVDGRIISVSDMLIKVLEECSREEPITYSKYNKKTAWGVVPNAIIRVVFIKERKPDEVRAYFSRYFRSTYRGIIQFENTIQPSLKRQELINLGNINYLMKNSENVINDMLNFNLSDKKKIYYQSLLDDISPGTKLGWFQTKNKTIFEYLKSRQ